MSKIDLKVWLKVILEINVITLYVNSIKDCLCNLTNYKYSYCVILQNINIVCLALLCDEFSLSIVSGT